MKKTYRRKNRKNEIVLRSVFLTVVILLLAALVFIWNVRISPNLVSIGEIRAKAFVSRIVHETIREKFSDDLAVHNLLRAETDSTGSIGMVQSDTAAINRLVSGLSVALQDRYREDHLESKSTVPLGALLGSSILSQSGPNIEITVIPAVVSGMDFITEFETAGINQTKYKVYIVLSTDVRVLAPFSSKMTEVTSTVLIAEAVILGEVPDSYVEVPKEDILDAI